MSGMRDKVAFSEFATPIDRFEPVVPTSEYRLLGMRSRAEGPFLRETKLGADISASRLNRVQAGDFIYSRLFAWQGSFGVIPSELDGCYVSNEFPLFTIDRDKALPEYLIKWFALPTVQRRVEADCKGSTPGTRNRYTEDHFLRLDLALPPLEQQQRIAESLSSLSARVAEAKRLRELIHGELDTLRVAMAHRNDLSANQKLEQGWQHLQLKEVLSQARDPVEVKLDQEYPHLGIFSFARGLFNKQPLRGDEIKATHLFRVQLGQFIYGRLNAYEGAFGVVTEEFAGCHVSSEFPNFTCNTQYVLPEFLIAYFTSPWVWENLKRQTTGIGGGAGNRRVHLKESVFLNQTMWLPPLERQYAIRNAYGKIELAKNLQNAVNAQLDALLPAVLDKAFKGSL